MITINQIYTQLSDGMDIYCTRRYEPVPASLPCLYFRESHFRPKPSVTLEYGDEVIQSTIYIELYAKSGMSDLITQVETLMNSMYYIEENCMEIDNADISIQRYTLTFSRIICGGDTL